MPRGAGTGLSGGALAIGGGVVVSLARMTRIIEVDVPNRRLRAEAGVVNTSLTAAAAAHGFCFAPDPSSQTVCTIGGNVAESAGGPHTLRYGVTGRHVTGLTVVLPGGEVVRLGGKEAEPNGYDLVSAFVGSEGTLGIVTEVTVRLTRLPEAEVTLLAAFPEIDDATRAVAAVIAAGLQPAALELMDRPILEAVEQAFRLGPAVGTGAALVIEFHGPPEGVSEAAARAETICREAGATEVSSARDETERARLWAARKKAVGALGHLSPSHVTHDGVVPRSRLPEVQRRVNEIARRHGLRNANVYHAGDGNLHPILLFDDADEAQVRAVVAAGEEILEVCLTEDGSVTGEHGIGVEKAGLLGWMYDAATVDAMRRLKGCFDPASRCNPGKVFPDSAHHYSQVPLFRRG